MFIHSEEVKSTRCQEEVQEEHIGRRGEDNSLPRGEGADQLWASSRDSSTSPGVRADAAAYIKQLLPCQ